MIEHPSFAFTETAPDLRNSATFARLREVADNGAWLRWSALILGTIAIAFALGCWAMAYLPDSIFRSFGIASPFSGTMTVAGNIFFVLVFGLGVVALRFSRRLFRDRAPYIQSADVIKGYDVRQGVIDGFGPWLKAGGNFNRLQRVAWKLGPLRGDSPYMRGRLSVWLEPGDPVFIGVDPAGINPPLFFGVKRPAPEILQAGSKAAFSDIYGALKAHMANSERWTDTDLLKVFGLRPPK